MGVNSPLNRKLRMGLVGGGQGDFIGRVHVTAAVLDNRGSLVAGALFFRSGEGQSFRAGLRLVARTNLHLVSRNADLGVEAARQRSNRFRVGCYA